VLAGWNEESAEVGDPLYRGLVCERESDSPVDCQIECHTSRSLGFNSGVELSHSKPSAKSITLLLLLMFTVFAGASKSGLGRVIPYETLASKRIPMRFCRSHGPGFV
jgi:hypothetical protein